MSGKSVATQADVQTQAGTTPFTGAVSGAWTPGAVSVVTYAKLTIGGQPAVSSASCTFSFSGTDGSNPVTGTEPVTLSAAALGTTKLQGQEQQVLRDGDQSNTSLFGNVIEISAAGKLSSG
jgi:hypothetical protein